MIQITCNYLTHKNKNCILLKSDFSSKLNLIYRHLDFVKYSNTNKSWYIPQNKELLKQVIEATKICATVDINPLKKFSLKQLIGKENINSINSASISKYNLEQLEIYTRELLLKAYSKSTINTYRNEFSVFLKILKMVNVDTITPDRLKDYFHYCITKLELSESTLHSRINAIKFYYEQILKKETFFFDIPRPNKPFKLPKVISEEKILTHLLDVKNIKHKTLLLLAYSAGLRVSEVVNLQIADIDSDRMQISIVCAKGKKDRIVPLSRSILILLREYYKKYKPKKWLFEGQEPALPYSSRSAQIIFKDAYKAVKLPPKTSFHSLRHSYATHLLDNGTDVKYIQKLLGHNDIKTTLRYLHVTNKDLEKIESPLDRILRKKDSLLAN